jgi:Fe-S cluster assembly iron-binding protein IscA
MVTVTENAKQELKKILLNYTDMSQARLRLVNRDDGELGYRDDGELGLGMDIEMPGDKCIEYDGLAVLVVEEKLAENLAGVTIDVDKTPNGSELVILGKPRE